MVAWWKYLVVIVVSYFLGNISFARILSKRRHSDITKQGSGNPGTMNMIRTHGIGLGALTLLLDASKGVLSALLGFFLFGGSAITEPVSVKGLLLTGGIYSNTTAITGLYLGGLSVVLGHNFPILYKFKGGKGIACTFGVYLVASPILVAISFIFCFVYLYIFDYATVASFIFLTILTYIEAQSFAGDLFIAILLFMIYFMAVYAHRSNFYRLLIGKENKVNFRKSLKKLYTKKEIKAEKKEMKAEIKKDKKEEIG